MIKNFTRLFFYLILLTIIVAASTLHAGAQTGPIIVQPTAIYRFQISYWDGGHLLTTNFQEGSANGYTFDPFNLPSFDGMGIYVPPPGYTADPSTGLVPLHRWRVIQNGWRVYFYYSTYFADHGSDYHYEGIMGWVFRPGTVSILNSGPLHPLSIWYSTDLGFWNGYNTFPGDPVEQPPNRPGKTIYFPQGLIAALPPTCVDPEFPQPPVGGGVCLYGMLFNPPPPPPPVSQCNVTQFIKNRCYQLGRYWDDDTCSCQYQY